jgi:hypothetical protein
VFNRSVGRTIELERILKLPRRDINDPAWDGLADELTNALNVVDKCPGALLPPDANGLCSMCKAPLKLRRIQAIAIHDIGTYGGLFAPIGVGEGKTLITLLAPYVLEAERPLLILPASLIKKTDRARVQLSRHWLIPENLQTISYEMLGRVQSAAFLEKYQPDLIIADEVHKLKNKRAAVTRRVSRYMKGA